MLEFVELNLSRGAEYFFFFFLLLLGLGKRCLRVSNGPRLGTVGLGYLSCRPSGLGCLC